MTRVLLITGARSLADSPDAERWARALIAEALAGCDLLIVGDAPGPDAWAWDESAGVTEERHRYMVRGRQAGAIEARSINDEALAWWAWGKGRAHPLDRNAAMVRDAVGFRDRDGDDVRCLALLDGTKRDEPGRRATRGTEHTAGLAERAGLTVRREVWTTGRKEVSDG